MVFNWLALARLCEKY